jgi:molybdopterin-guanine dinucleotide biosynthesis protein A
MGRDKSLLVVGGSEPLIVRVSRAMTEAGAADVFSVGGDGEAQGALGIRMVPDLHPGEGPLGGIITALRASPENLVVVLACDTPGITVAVPTALVRALEGDPEADVAVVRIGERRHPLNAAWRRDRCLAVLESLYNAGERAPRIAFSQLQVLDVVDVDGRLVEDVDSPSDLDRYSESPEQTE